MGNVGLREALRITLQAIADGENLLAPASIPGARDTMSIADTCIRLKTTGLVAKDTRSGNWILTKEAIYWLNAEDDLFLAAVLCSNVRFCGEMLSHLNSPKKERELLAIAVGDYGMTWKTNSEIHARNDWFRSLGVVEHHEYSHQYELTALGRTLLSIIEVASSQDVADETSRSVVASSAPSQWALGLCSLTDGELSSRGMSIGHICGPSSGIAITLSDTVGFLSEARTIDEFNTYAMSVYGCSETSAQSYRSTLRILGFLEDCPVGVRATENALIWNATASPTDLACYIHSRRRAVFELIHVLKDGAKDRKELTTAALVRYGCAISRDNLSKRISILRNAGLITGDRIIEATDAGVRILDLVSIEKPQVINDNRNGQALDGQRSLFTRLQDLFTELHQASQDSDNYERFENVCVDAFAALGFGTKHVGKPGKTDVLATAQCANRYAYKVIVDAKSSRHPVIGINDINFDSIDKHRRVHEAKYAVVVAKGFSDASVIDFAKKHDTVLLTVETLCQLIQEHTDAPISSQDYVHLFESSGLADISAIKTARERVQRYGDLLRSVMECLCSESDDEEYGGILGVQSIRTWMRGNPKIAINPRPEEISAMLELLASPMIRCVGVQTDAFGRGHNGYYAIGSLSEAANKFAFYMRACE